MAKIKKTVAKFKDGDSVKNNISYKDDVMFIKGDPTWNGYVWMYAFEGTDLRCGEQYLKKAE